MKWIKASERLPEYNKPMNGRITDKLGVHPGIMKNSKLSDGYITFNGNLERANTVEWLDESTPEPSDKVREELKESIRLLKGLLPHTNANYGGTVREDVKDKIIEAYKLINDYEAALSQDHIPDNTKMVTPQTYEEVMDKFHSEAVEKSIQNVTSTASQAPKTGEKEGVKEYLTKLKSTLDSWNAGHWTNRDIYEAFKADPNDWESFEQWFNEMKHILTQQPSQPEGEEKANVFDLKDGNMYTAEQVRYIRDQAYTEGMDHGSQKMLESIEHKDAKWCKGYEKATLYWAKEIERLKSELADLKETETELRGINENLRAERNQIRQKLEDLQQSDTGKELEALKALISDSVAMMRKGCFNEAFKNLSSTDQK